MLSELILAAVPSGDRPGGPYLSCSGLFPCQYQMHLSHIGKRWQENTAVDLLNMADGWDQEEQAVKRLGRAGIKVLCRGKEEGYLEVGRSKITGHIDGEIDFGGTRYLWEHKAMGSDRFWLLKTKGIEAFPGYKCQAHAYMKGRKLKKCIFQAKNKESNEPYDIVFELDEDFINPIIEWADQIRLKEIEPKPLKSDACKFCGVNCFGIILDFSMIKAASAKEVAEKWRQGKALQFVGKAMEEEAKAVLVGVQSDTGEWIEKGLVGGADVLLVEGLKILKIVSHPTKLDKGKLLALLGPDKYYSAVSEGHNEYYKITDTLEKEVKA